MTIVAANGDQLRGSFTTTGQGDTVTVKVTINSGTGRFANASGTLAVICLLSGPPRQEEQTLILQHDCTAEGEIRY